MRFQSVFLMIFSAIPSRSTALVALICLGFLIRGSSLLGQKIGSKPSNTTATFASILEGQTAKTFDLIKSYIQDNPQAPDAESAYEWLFTTAGEHGWEAQSVALAEAYLNRQTGELPHKTLAASIRTIGWAKSGKWDEAMLGFEKQLSEVRLRTPTPTVELAQSLATQAQIAGKPEFAQEIFQNLSRSLFLNPTVRMLCDKKLEKLKLVGQPAPEIGVRDLAGDLVALSDYRGKWLLLDFWATNCPPCLKAFPKLKSLHKSYAAKGFTIVGLSLDDDADTVDSFQNTHSLPWKLALSQTDQGQTRDRYHVPTIPSLYLINPEGRVQVIDPTPQEIEQVLKSALSTK